MTNKRSPAPPSTVLDLLAAAPAGMHGAEIARALGLSNAVAGKRLQVLRCERLVAVVGMGALALWCLPRDVEMTSERHRERLQAGKRARVERDRLRHRARVKSPVFARPRVNSVWALGALA